MPEKALLPPGLADVLPPQAAFEAHCTERLIEAFGSRGYDRVKPPLIEFEANLLAGTGAAMADQTFRLMDPASHRMMGLRADMTPQIARIATTRLGAWPRPLRIAYAGDVLRVQGAQLRPERQFTQVGAEIIDAGLGDADAEVIAMAVDGLAMLGVERISVDLGLPTLVPAMLADLAAPAGSAAPLRQALDRKDAAGTAAICAEIGGDAGDLLVPLVGAAGPVAYTLAQVATLDLGDRARAEWRNLERVVRRLGEALPDTALTVDPVENRGFKYHSGVIFTFFAQGVRGELGSGGRYLAGAGGGGGESATGFTLFMDSVMRALPAAPAPRRLFVPADAASAATLDELRRAGWVTVMGLREDAGDDDAEEARRNRCTHVLVDGAPGALDPEEGE